MRWRDIILLSRSAMKGNRLRTNLTIAIIAVGITALISILTVIEVLKWNIYNNLNGMGANTFTLMSNKNAQKKNASKTPMSLLTLEEVKNFKAKYRFPSIISISYMADNNAMIQHGKKKTNPNVIVMGGDADYMRVSATNMLAGRNFNTREESGNTNVCLLGYGIAKNLY